MFIFVQAEKKIAVWNKLENVSSLLGKNDLFARQLEDFDYFSRNLLALQVYNNSTIVASILHTPAGTAEKFFTDDQ